MPSQRWPAKLRRSPHVRLLRISKRPFRQPPCGALPETKDTMQQKALRILRLGLAVTMAVALGGQGTISWFFRSGSLLLAPPRSGQSARHWRAWQVRALRYANWPAVRSQEGPDLRIRCTSLSSPRPP